MVKKIEKSVTKIWKFSIF